MFLLCSVLSPHSSALAQFSAPAWPATNNNTFPIGVTPATNTQIIGSTAVSNGVTSWHFILSNGVTFVASTNYSLSPSALALSGEVWSALVEITNTWVKLYVPPLPSTNTSYTIDVTNLCITAGVTSQCVAVDFNATNFVYASGTSGTNTHRFISSNNCCIVTDSVTTITIDACQVAVVVTNTMVITQTLYTAISVTNPGNLLTITGNGEIPFLNPIKVATNALDCTNTNHPQLIASSSRFLSTTNQFGATTNNPYYFFPQTNASLQAFQFWPADMAVAQNEREDAIEAPTSFHILPVNADTSTGICLANTRAALLAMAPYFAMMSLADTNGDFTAWCNSPTTNLTFNINNAGSIAWNGTSFYNETNIWQTNITVRLPPAFRDTFYIDASGTGLTTIAPIPFELPLLSGAPPEASLAEKFDLAAGLPRVTYDLVISTNAFIAGWFVGQPTGMIEDDGTPNGFIYTAYTITQRVTVSDFFSVNFPRHFYAGAGNTNPITGALGHLVTNIERRVNLWMPWLTNSSLSKVFTNPLPIAGNMFLNIKQPFVFGVSNSYNAFGQDINRLGNVFVQASNSWMLITQITGITNFIRTNITGTVTNTVVTNTTSIIATIIENDWATNAVVGNLGAGPAHTALINSRTLFTATLTNAANTNVTATMITTNWDVAAGLTELDYDWDTGRRALSKLTMLAITWDGSWSATNNRAGSVPITALFNTNLWGGATLSSNIDAASLSSLLSAIPAIGFTPNQTAFAPGSSVTVAPGAMFRKDWWTSINAVSLTNGTPITTVTNTGWVFWHGHNPANRTCFTGPFQSVISWTQTSNDVWDTTGSANVDTIGEFVDPALVIVPQVNVSMQSAALFYTDITRNFASAKNVYLQGSDVPGVVTNYPVYAIEITGANIGLATLTNTYDLCDSNPSIIDEPQMIFISITNAAPANTVSNLFYDPILQTPVTGTLTQMLYNPPAIWSLPSLSSLNSNGAGRIAALASAPAPGTNALVWSGLLSNHLIGTLPTTIDGINYKWGITEFELLLDLSITNPPPGGFQWK